MTEEALAKAFAAAAPDDGEDVEDEGNLESREDATPRRKRPMGEVPKDRLNVEVLFGAPPRRSLYHTERAQRTRERALAELGSEFDDAANILLAAGGKRSHHLIADSIDHNALTLAYALRYAECGLHVADAYGIDPLTGAGMSMSGDAKVPFGAGWQERASTDRNTIISFWTGKGRYPENKDGKAWRFKRVGQSRNVSIVLPYGCNLFVLDEDGDDGMSAMADLEAKHGKLPLTPDSRSGSGNGRHRIFRTTRPIRNTASQVAPGVDIRGEGGQIIAAPSIHKTGNFYQWAEGCAPWECDIADAPEWLEDLAFDAMKANTAKVKQERRKARAEARATGKPCASGGLGFEGHLEAIGDGDGLRGFDRPIYAAACSWWASNPDGDADDLFDTLRDVVLAAPCKNDRAETRYASDDYLAERIDQARKFIEKRRAADEEADREEAEALDAARAVLRERLREEDGATTLAADAAERARARLRELGHSEEDAADFVEEAVADVLRQLKERADDRAHDPVEAARAEEDVSTPAVFAPLYDDRLVDEEGFMVHPGDNSRLYKSYKIDPKADHAEEMMRREIRAQIVRALMDRVSYVVLDGEAKYAFHAAQGENVRLWKEATLSKLYANRGVSYMGGEKGNTVKDIKPADVFARARQRDTYFDTCFEPDPTKARIAEARGAFNLWTGLAVNPAPGDWSKLKDHIRDQICGGDDDLFNWVMTWLASLFARPGVKIPSAIAVQGEQGTGKSKVFDWVRRAIGAAAIKISNGRHLTGNFNAHMDGKIFMTCEESFWGGEKAAAGIIKDLISSDTLQIEGKFANVVERPNYVNLAFVSNDAWMIPTDNEDARRFCVLTCLPTKKQDAAFFGAIDDQMESGGLAAMVCELIHWDPKAVGLTWDSLRNPPVTEGLRQQVGMGLRGAMAHLAAIIESGELSGREGDATTFYYDLDEDVATDVARSHLMAALYPDKSRGNMNAEAKDAIAKLLGDDADGGENKRVVHYFGGFKPGEDTRDNRKTEKARFVTFPPLSVLRAKLRQYGRGD